MLYYLKKNKVGYASTYRYPTASAASALIKIRAEAGVTLIFVLGK